MDKQQTMKTFSVEEANNLLPVISGGVERISFLFQRLRSLTKDIEDLQYIWGKDVADSGNMDNAYYLEKVGLRERAAKEVNGIISDINSLGCVVKDAENGLVDFYHENKGEMVFLCWKHGEKRVEHWHAVEAGFGTRQHIDKMK